MDTLGPQVFTHTEEPDPAKVEPVENFSYFKPTGGIWTSSLDGDVSGWIRWCKGEQWGISEDTKMWILYPESDLDIYTVDGLGDLQVLIQEYSISGAAGLREYVDYQGLAWETSYDGMRVTARGEHETRFSEPSLYGWDCESTLHFDWNFTDVEYVGYVTDVIDF